MLRLLIVPYKAPHCQVPTYRSPFLKSSSLELTHYPAGWLFCTPTYLYANRLWLEFLCPSSYITLAAASEWASVLGIGYEYGL